MVNFFDITRFNPATNTYTGSPFDDDFSTIELARSYPNRGGFSLYGMDGDDSIETWIISESRKDYLVGGNGDDLFAALSLRTTSASVDVSGGMGTDGFFSRRAIAPYTFSINGPRIEFTVYNNEDYSPLSVSASLDVEILAFTRPGSPLDTDYYLTEDIANGRIRTVSTDELSARAYEGNPDWYINGLDTYTEYHKTPGVAGALTSSTPKVFREGMTLTAGAVTGDPSGMPFNPNYTYQWFRNGTLIQGATARSYRVPSGGYGTYRVAVSYTDAEGFRSTISTPSQSVGRILTGTSANNTLTGSIGSDLITGFGGADRMTGGADRDTFRYTNLIESRLASLDRITDFAIGSDSLEVPRAMVAGNVRQAGRANALTQKGINSVLTKSNFLANRAASFTLGTGAGTRTFVALNDRSSGFDVNRDGLIEITGYSGRLASLTLTRSA
jgi:Ca2+-binding RTX toxin-like protein